MFPFVRSGLICCLVPPLVLAPDAHAMQWPGAQGGRALYLPLIMRESAARGLPPALADAVAMVETAYRLDAVGSAGEVGLMQVMPATARQLGFAGTLAELAEPATNIHLGVAYLARAWSRSGGNVCGALTRYRAGLEQAVMTALSARYCTRAMAWLSATGSGLANGAHLPGIAEPLQAANPHVIAVLPALAALARLRPLLVTDHEAGRDTLPRRTIAERNATRNDLFLSHLRHLGPGPATATAMDQD